MFESIALIIVFGYIGSVIFKFFKLPGLIGMLLSGILIGPFGLNLIDDTMLLVSGDIRRIALIIILLRAGLGLNRTTLKIIGKQATFLSVIPVLFEGFVLTFAVMWLLDFSFVVAGMTGFIIAAVSPAVIVPSMLQLMKDKIGERKHIPALILSSASVDDVIAITIFSTFLSVYFTQSINIVSQVLSIPLSIILGVLLGLAIGFITMFIFNKYKIRDSAKVILLLSVGILLVSLGDLLERYVLIASLLGVMTIGVVITEKKHILGERLAIKFDKVWVLAEIFLFVLVGAAVDVNVALEAGLLGLLIIMIGLLARSLGVFVATIKSRYTLKEKAFITFAFLPKATVQAAVGSVPLIMGVNNGEIILALAVLSIIITAPLGAILIQASAVPFLRDETKEEAAT